MLIRILLFLGLAAGVSCLVTAEAGNISQTYTKYEYRIPMRDGVRLFTAVYVPKDTSQKWPILMKRTPYGVGPYGTGKFPKDLGPSTKFEQDKFIFVDQDVRGRNMSEGEWVEMRPEKDVTHGLKDVDESTDTYDTVDWLIKNVPNNNGKAGLLGISYPGFYASCGLINSHPALVAVSPQAPIADLYMGDDSYHNGSFFLIANFSFYVFFNKQHNPEIPGPETKFNYGTKDGYKFYLNMGPIINSEKMITPSNPYWNDSIEHTNYDQFWQKRDILPHLKNVKPAVLVVGGWFDAEDLSGTFKTYRAIREQSPSTDAKFVMGPWFHGGWSRSPGNKLGDIAFGSNTSQFFEDQIELPFFRHYLKGAPDPQLPQAAVFETGKNEWRRESHWPPENTSERRLYLHSDGALSFDAPKERSAFDEYVSDPSHPVPSFEQPTLVMPRPYMDADQRFVEHRPDVLTFETEPLKEDLTIAGPISPSLYVSTTGTDSDFVVKVIDVYPKDAPAPLSGYEQLVRGEPFRGKFRNGFEHPEPFKAGELARIHFTMPDVYHCFQKGHRVMIQIQSSWFPLVDRNPQTFTNIPKARPADFVKARERIYRSADAASFIGMSVQRF